MSGGGGHRGLMGGGGNGGGGGGAAAGGGGEQRVGVNRERVVFGCIGPLRSERCDGGQLFNL